METKKHAATLTKGTPGVLHGSYSYLLQDEEGQIIDPHSISAGWVHAHRVTLIGGVRGEGRPGGEPGAEPKKHFFANLTGSYNGTPLPTRIAFNPAGSPTPRHQPKGTFCSAL